jgi:predicted Zn finger-like uncharacterized protein
MLAHTIGLVLITCPECQSEFDVPDEMIGADGRRLRCASCRHVWHQEGPKAAAPDEEAPMPFEAPSPLDIPASENTYSSTPDYAPPKTPISATGFEIDFEEGEAEAPRAEGPSFQDIVADPGPQVSPFQKKAAEKRPSGDHARTAMVACVVALVLCLGLVAMRDTLAEQSSFLRYAYRGLGLNITMPGHGVGIDRVVLKPVWTETGVKVEVSTRLLNLTDKDVRLSDLLIEVMDDQGKPQGKYWRFSPPVPRLPKDGTAPFTASLADLPPGNENLSLRMRVLP